MTLGVVKVSFNHYGVFQGVSCEFIHVGVLQAGSLEVYFGLGKEIGWRARFYLKSLKETHRSENWRRGRELGGFRLCHYLPVNNVNAYCKWETGHEVVSSHT